MKGLAPLFLGIFGTFAFSWVGLTVIPNWQIGHLDPQMEEDGSDAYPQPQSGMVERGARVYAANGCIYCHSQQVRADYAADDIERKWGGRRSAPRDYIFERPVFLGKMRMGQDLSNIGARAPAEQENAPPAGAASSAASPAQQGGAPAPSAAPSGASPSPPANAGSPPPGAPPPKATAAPPQPAGSPATAPAAASPSPPANAGSPPPGAPPPASPTPPAAANASPAAGAPWPVQTSGEPPMYSAAWHHVHLYSPRSINVDSNMPSYRFLYQTRRINNTPSDEALKFSGSEAPPEGWEIIPTYDAKCLVAYLISLNQSHSLKEVRSAAPAAPPPAAPKK
jgi:cbb3-type cytochrome oxidase cytochrome c subunit